MQCRITTEDPENNFLPDYGRLTTYRSPGGFAVRLDGGNGFGGAVITPYFDSLLVKVHDVGSDLQGEHPPHGPGLARVSRARREDQYPVPRKSHQPPQFRGRRRDDDVYRQHAGTCSASVARRDRATKILSYLGDVIINGRPEVKGKVDPKRELPEPVIPPYARRARPPPPGLRNKLLELGPEKFAAYIREQKQLLFTDTTMRDAHQSLLATRVRTFDLLQIADCVAHLLPGLVQPGDVGRGDV